MASTGDSSGVRHRGAANDGQKNEEAKKQDVVRRGNHSSYYALKPFIAAVGRGG